MRIKAKYDKDGVEIVEDEKEIGKADGVAQDARTAKARQQQAVQDANEAQDRAFRDGTSRTRSGKGVKPGGAYLKSDFDL